MRLSEAIILGSTLGKLDPWRWLNDGCGCAQGLAYMAAVGKRSCGETEINEAWPWVTRPIPNYGLPYRMRIGGLAAQVHNGEMTIDGLSGIVAAWEDELAAKGINVEQVTGAAELTEPASPTQSVEKELELDCVATPRGGEGADY